MQTELIVEVGNTHEGSLGVAKSFVDMAVYAGAKVVKFQMHLSEYESSADEEFRTKFSDQDNSRIDYWNRVSFSPKQWRIISDYCESKGVEFLCTPFSIEAAQLLMSSTNVRRWKVGSGDAANFPLIDFLANTKLPLIISTGLISWNETLLLKKRLISLNAFSRTTLMHCVSQYPTPLEKSALNLISELQSLGCRVGLSDHSGKISPSLFAISRGISLLEVHMKPHQLYFGPDVSSSLLVDQIRAIADFIQDAEILEVTKISKDQLYNEANQNRRLFRKGIRWRKSLNTGTKVTAADLIFLKPSNGIDAIDFERVVGKVLAKNVLAREPVRDDDFN